VDVNLNNKIIFRVSSMFSLYTFSRINFKDCMREYLSEYWQISLRQEMRASSFFPFNIEYESRYKSPENSTLYNK